MGLAAGEGVELVAEEGSVPAAGEGLVPAVVEVGVGVMAEVAMVSAAVGEDVGAIAVAAADGKLAGVKERRWRGGGMTTSGLHPCCNHHMYLHRDKISVICRSIHVHVFMVSCTRICIYIMWGLLGLAQ